MHILEFLKHQPTGYISNIGDITGQTYSRLNTIMSKLRKNKKLNAHEVEILMRGISILEGKDYTVLDFTS